MKKQTVETELVKKQRIINTKYYCDRCNEEYNPWEENGFVKDSFVIERRIDRSYPEGYSYESEKSYLCLSCGEDIMKILKENNVKFENIFT